MNNLKSNVETAFAQAGQKGLEILKLLLSRINENFKSGGFNSFFIVCRLIKLNLKF